MNAMNRCDLIVRNAYVITMNTHRDVFPSGAIAIQGNEIVAVGPESEIRERYDPLREIEILH